MNAKQMRGTPRLARRGLLFFLLLLFMLPGAHTLQAQSIAPPLPHDPRSIDATHLGPAVNLNGTWLAHAGDDPRFADPSYDDRNWQVVSTAQLITQYFPHVDRLWYRAHVRVDPATRGLGLLLHGTLGSVQVFVNGTRLSSLGSFAPNGDNVYDEIGHVIAIPDAATATGELTVAVRVSVGRVTAVHHSAGLTPESMVALGPLGALKDQHSLYGFRDLTSNFTNLTFNSILLLVTLALACVLRSNKEYVALLLQTFAVSWMLEYQISSDLYPHGSTLFSQLLNGSLATLSCLAQFEFCRIVLGIRRSRTIAAWEIAYAVQALLAAGATGTFLYRGAMVSAVHAELVGGLVNGAFLLPLRIGIPIAAVWVWRKRRSVDAAILLVPVSIDTFFDYADRSLLAMKAMHLSTQGALGNAPIPYFMVNWNEVGEFISTLALLLFIVVRALRMARERATLDAEVHAAQSVQQLLLTRSAQDTPGFRVETAYRPASEVGGDFFLVCPYPGGPGEEPSLVAVVGDVSGKGLPAAMRVSMILGVLRRERSHDPAAIMASLNDALLFQSEMGFTTACCVHLRACGRFTIANAGHLNPYVMNREVETAPALPLGLAAHEQYALTSGQLGSHEHLVLVSDGVLEARSRKGELFGFERLVAIASRSAEQIAQTAQDFGQDDDITVVTLACAP